MIRMYFWLYLKLLELKDWWTLYGQLKVIMRNIYASLHSYPGIYIYDFDYKSKQVLPAGSECFANRIISLPSTRQRLILVDFPTTGFGGISGACFPWIWCNDLTQFFLAFFTHHFVLLILRCLFRMKTMSNLLLSAFDCFGV